MKRTKVLVLTMSALLLTVSAALAFVFAGDPPFKWASNDLPRNVIIDSDGHPNVTDGDNGVSAINTAITSNPDGWNASVPGSLISTSLNPSPPASIGDSISTMHFQVAGTGCSGGCLAITWTPIPPSSPTETVNGQEFTLMTDSDIFFNPSTKFYSDEETNGCKREFHIESVAVHEVGHLLGLGHTNVSNATMFASVGHCDANAESLAADDIDGINCAYNNGYGCGGCQPDTLIVDRTECSSPTKGRNKGDFVVETYIVDNCGNPAAGALVRIDVDGPTGSLFCEGTTSGSGRLACALDNPPAGTYTATVSSVTLSGYNWPGSECGGGSDPCLCSITIN